MTTTTLDFQRENVAQTRSRIPAVQDLTVGLAFTPEDVRDAQRLRYQVFAEEMGATLHTTEAGIDSDAYDPWCQHLIVRDQLTRKVVASTRVLLDAEARLAGGFYSASEFDMSRLQKQSGRLMEIGRTCVHPDYRSGGAISLLWSGLARFIDIRRYEYLIGCASVPMSDDGAAAADTYDMLKHKYLVSEPERVTPRRPLPASARSGAEQSAPPSSPPSLPPLLKAYIRLGARIGGEPCWDPDFACADFFIVLSPAALERRYAKRFLAA